jgi:hypothetical protein
MLWESYGQTFGAIFWHAPADSKNNIAARIYDFTRLTNMLPLLENGKLEDNDYHSFFDQKIEPVEFILLMGDLNVKSGFGSAEKLEKSVLENFFQQWGPEQAEHEKFLTSYRMINSIDQNEEALLNPFDKILVYPKECSAKFEQTDHSPPWHAATWKSSVRARRYSDHTYVHAELKLKGKSEKKKL